MTNLLLINKGSLRAIGFALLLGCSSLFSSIHTNFTKVNSTYFNIGRIDDSLIGFTNHIDCGFMLSKFSKLDRHIFDFGIEYAKAKQSNSDVTSNKRAVILNLHIFKKIPFNPILTYKFIEVDKEIYANVSGSDYTSNWRNYSHRLGVSSLIFNKNKNIINISLSQIWSRTVKYSSYSGSTLLYSEENYNWSDTGSQLPGTSMVGNIVPYGIVELGIHHLLFNNIMISSFINQHLNHDIKGPGASFSIILKTND